jgi:hypothetical protein
VGRSFADDLRGMDDGIQELIRASETEVSDDPEVVEGFLQTIVDMAGSAKEGLGAFKELADTIQPIEGLSRDLRPPLRDMRTGLTVAYDGLPIMLRWRDMALDAQSLLREDRPAASEASEDTARSLRSEAAPLID